MIINNIRFIFCLVFFLQIYNENTEFFVQSYSYVSHCDAYYFNTDFIFFLFKLTRIKKKVNAGSDRFPPNKPNARGVEITVVRYQKCPTVSVVTGRMGVCDISDLSSVASPSRSILSANQKQPRAFII